MAPQRDEIFKQKVNDCAQHIILQKFTNFHALRSCSFQNICNEIGWPCFFAPPCTWSLLNRWRTYADRALAKQLSLMRPHRTTCVQKQKVFKHWTSRTTTQTTVLQQLQQSRNKFTLFSVKCSSERVTNRFRHR